MIDSAEQTLVLIVDDNPQNLQLILTLSGLTSYSMS